MNDEIKELQEAMEDMIETTNNKFTIDIAHRKARQRVVKAREQLHFKTQDLLEAAELQRE